MEVGAGVATTPTVATVPCPRSVGFSLTQMARHSRRGSHDLPKRQLPRRSIIDFVFLLYTIYELRFCKLCNLSQPNPLPVAGGGCFSPYSKLRMYARSLEPRYWLLTSSSEVCWHLIGQFLGQFPIKFSFRLGSSYQVQLPFSVAKSSEG